MDNYFLILFLLIALAGLIIIPGLLVILLSKLEKKLPKGIRYLVPLIHLIIFSFFYFELIGKGSYIINEYGFVIMYYFGMEFAIALIICIVLDIQNKYSTIK